MVGINMDGPARDRVMKLIQEKDRIESEIRDHTAILETNNVGMNDPLVDAEGFPRIDIDVYKVRHARHSIICLQNDHKNIMKLIEKGLVEVHSDIRGSTGESPSAARHTPTTSTNGHTANGHNSGDDSATVPFAFVSLVDDGSPADIDGLCKDDKIVQFGSVNYRNFEDMPQIYNIVSHSVGQPINVRVKRDQNIMSLTVTPRPWARNGVLGCHIQRLALP